MELIITANDSILYYNTLIIVFNIECNRLHNLSIFPTPVK